MPEVTMEEKLRRWKQAKQEGLQRKQGRVGERRHGVQEMTVGVKRKLSEAKMIGKKARSPAIQHSSEPGKNPRSSATKCSKSVLREKSSKPVHHSTHGSVKSHLTASGKAPKTDPGARRRLQDGCSQSPILIEHDQEIPALKRRNLIKTTPVAKKSLPESKTPTLLPPQDGSAKSPILIENDREIPILKNFSPSQPSLVVNKESPETRTPPVQLTRTFGVDSDSDKENQCEMDVPINQNVLELPAVVTVEKKPELLAKDLIRVAITFEKKRRLVTAYSIFRRAYHVLPKKSAKLTERLLRLEHDCTAASLQLPSQELSTSAYMVKVLERDLMDVLNNGSTKELTDLHAIGAKRAELVLGRRPYHKLEELQRVLSITANVVAKLHHHHTNWENHH